MGTTTRLQVVDFNIKGSNGNFLLFSATAGFIGKPTRATPCGGAKGYHVILGDGGNVSELVGAGVNCSHDYKRHNKAFKIGVIDAAEVGDDGYIFVDGHLWRTDFPDICDTIECAKDSLGCSVEVYSNGVDIDDEAKTQTLRDVHFTGMSIVYKNKAAFEGTNFMCSIADEEGKSLTEKELQAAVDQAVGVKIEELKAQLRAEFSQQLEDIKDVKSVQEQKEGVAQVPIQPTVADFSGVGDIVKAAVRDAVLEWAASVDEKQKQVAAPTIARKTKLFATEAQFQSEKSLVELSKEIDDDPNLSAEQKWAAQMRLWNERQSA